MKYLKCALVLGLLGLTSLSVAPGASAAAPAKVTFAVSSTSIDLLPEYLCTQDQFCQKQGVDVKYVNVLGGPASLAAVESGSVDFSVVSSFQVFAAVAQGAKIVAVSQETQGFPTEVFLTNKAISEHHIKPTTDTRTALNDLKGLKIGNLGAGTTYSLILAGLLKKEHYPSNWLDFVNVTGTADQLAAIKSGTIDGVITAPGAPEIAAQAGEGKIVYSLENMNDFRVAAGGIMIVNKSWASGHASLVHDLVKGYDETQAWMGKHKAKASQQMAKLFNVQSNVALQTYEHVHFPTTSFMPPASWSAAERLANDYGLASNKVTDKVAKAVYTNQYFK